MELTGNSLAQRLMQLALQRPDTRVAAAKLEDPAQAAFDRAIGHFEHGRWSDAFEALVPLADGGHREAARIAALMSARGPRLFGQAFAASPSQRDRWLEAAGRADAAD